MTDDAANTPSAPFRDRPRVGAALLIIDMISEMDFPGGGAMQRKLAEIADAIGALRDEADKAEIPTIYVNDNFGEWHSERSRLLERAQDSKSRGAEVARRLAPRDHDYFVIKPQFSGFYSTNLPVLLPKLGVDRLILTGISTDVCILFTAADAHMRDYRIWVPNNTTAAPTPEGKNAALAILAGSLGAETGMIGRQALADWTR